MTQVLAKTRVSKIAGYEILGKLRAGAQGTVFLARDPHHGGEVAIKVLSEKMTNDPTLRMRFAQECQVARSLEHPNIARVIDFGLDGDRAYLVMEYVKGESVGRLVDRSGRLPECAVVAVAKQIGQALALVHERGLIHRDVTPDNIIISDDGVAKLIDLGLVKDTNGEFNLTQSKSSLGTPNFTAPEQFDDAKRVEPTSDIYGFAATLYMAITGQLPFHAGSTFAIVTIYKKKLSDDLIPPQQLAPDVSDRVSDALCRALRADPKKRPATVLKFVETLEESPSEKNGRERRVKSRYPVKMAIRCSAASRLTSDRWEGMAVDMSETGFCVKLSRGFQPGTILNVRLGKKKLQRRSLLVRVMWVKKTPDGAWKLGCQFDRPLSEQELNEYR